MATTLEEYQIVIAANAERASSGIDRFIGSLNNFKVSIGQAIAPAKAFAEAMKAIAGSASAMNLANIGTQAEKFAKAMKNAALANKSGGLYKPPASIKEAEDLIHNYEEQDILKARREGLRNRLRDTMSMEMPDASKEASLVAQIQKTDAQMQSLDRGARNFAQDMAKGASQVEILNLKMNGIVKNLAFETSKKTLDSSRIASLVAQYQSVSQKIAQLRANQQAASDGARQFAENVAKGATQASILEDKMASIVAKIATEQSKPDADPGKIATLSEQYQRLQAKLAEVQAQAQETGKSIGQSLGEAAQNGVSKFEKFTSRIGRILSTMLIRTAMRAFMKEFSEMWDAMEKYSKDHGGEFAQTMSMIRGAVSQAAVSLATALAPAMRFVAAAANVATGAIKVLANAINWLLGLLGASTEFLGMSTEALDGYTNASGGASGANKDLLASFDELNVIQSSGGGGSPTGGGMDLSSFNEGLSAELAAIEMIIAESMLALGVILTFTGHPGIGIPLMILGLAGVVAEATLNWDSMSEEVKGECTKIMIIAGGAMLAIGAIIAASGANLPLGIALMVVGAANLAGAVALSWGIVSKKVKDEIGKILVYVGTALLAIGAILALSGANIPLGIALMAAGGVSIVAAVALNWDGIKTTVINTFNKIKEGIVNAWENVKIAVHAAWDAVVQWASAKWSDFARGWENIKVNLQKLWDKVSKAVTGAWEAVKTWLASKWSDFSRAWDRIKDGFDKIWDNVKGFVTGAWDAVVVWIEAVWTDFQNNWNNIKAGFEAIWIFIKTAVANAWLKVQTWINAKWTQFSAGWDYIKQQMEAIWNGIKEAANTAYLKAKEFLEKKWDDFKSGWEDIKENIGIIWGDIKQSAVDAYVGVQAWLVTTWKNFEKGWNNIKESMSAIWTGIKQSVVSAYNAVADWWGNMVGKIEEAWRDVSKWFYDNVTHPIEEAFNGVIDTIKGWINTVIGALNDLGRVHIPKVTIPFTNVVLIPEMDVNLWNIPTLPVSTKADGDLNIRNGQLFIANEAGPELIGTIGGNSAVANQMQIIEGIRKGVHDANEDQNALLRQQNELLLEILQKDSGFGSDASIAFGRFAKRSIALYNQSMGGK